jgi:hypothetical protein
MDTSRQYEDRVVFFFDILGFRDLISKEFEKNPNNSEKIYEAFEFINKFYEDEIPDKYNPSKQITFFSDSLVISFVYDEPDLIFSTICTIQILLVNLLLRGIVMRGGISVGKLLHNEKYLFGPAFIDAYDIESKIAIYPRIICKDSIIILSQKGKPLNSARQDLEIFTQIVRQDTDKFWYIDYIENIESLFNTGVEQIEYLTTAYNFIKESLSQNPEGKVNEKYQWLRRKYNSVAKDILNNEKLKKTDYELYLCTRELKLIE